MMPYKNCGLKFVPERPYQVRAKMYTKWWFFFTVRDRSFS